MEGFLVQDTLTVLTQNGDCHIQLCLGDITKLKLKDKVDVILISAFQGDYSPTPTSVIGALSRNLGIVVRNLARDKEEDLRKLYHCWWSKPLPEDKPYKRLLCFETKVFGSRRPQELVGDVFRCLVPILNNQDGTVITPLLNTGDQGFGQEVMLTGMVEAAVNWMKAGLPLRMLKIVLYCRGENDQAMERSANTHFKRVLKCFEELKERYMMKDLTPKEVSINFDVYLSSSKYDTDFVSLILDKLHSSKKDIRIYNSNQSMNVEAVWQEDMYEVMMHSARVITVLTPNYLQCTSCIEQYNIAMCCSRKAMRNMLAPFYVQETCLPTYMTQVQYVDCRSRVQECIGEACLQVVISLSLTLKPKPQVDLSIQYDVFVSYSHTDSERANHIVETLRRLNPDLRLFFDIQELKTGSAWQRTLYHSIDGSRVMLALISNKYLSSAVCKEEYNLALARHCSDATSLKLVPICIEDLHGIAPEFTKIKMVNGVGDSFPEAVDKTCTAIVDWLAGKDMSGPAKELFQHNSDMDVDVDVIAESMRRLKFQMQHGNKDKLLKKNAVYPPELPKALPRCTAEKKEDINESNDEASKCDIAFSYAVEDEKYALWLASVLGSVKEVAVKVKASSDHERLALMDKAKHIIALMSPHYTDSPEKCEEFNIALSRQRLSTYQIIFLVHIHVLPKRPTYFRLVSAGVNAVDKIWPELCTVLKIDTHIDRLMCQEHSISEPVKMALCEAAYQILHEIKKQRTSQVPSLEDVKPSPVLFNIKKLMQQVQVAFTNSTNSIGEYLLSLSPNDDGSSKATSHILQENDQAVMVSVEEKQPNTDQLEPVGTSTSSSQADSSYNNEPVPTGSYHPGTQDAAVGTPAQEHPVSTSSDQLDKPSKEPDSANLPASPEGRRKIRKGTKGISESSTVVRSHGNSQKGSSSCSVV